MTMQRWAPTEVRFPSPYAKRKMVFSTQLVQNIAEVLQGAVIFGPTIGVENTECSFNIRVFKCWSSAIPGKQNKTKNTGPVVLHTLKPQLTVGKVCPSINAGYLSAGQQLIWLAASLVWTRLLVSPSYWTSSPLFPIPTNTGLECVQISIALPPSLLRSTAQAFLWARNCKALASL